MADMKMADMRQKAKNLKESNAVKLSDAGHPSVPYGLHVTLGPDELDKLGVKTMPAVGDKVHVRAHAHVARVSETHETGGKKHRSVELHLHHMAMEQPKKSGEDAAKGAKAEMDKVLKSPDLDENHDADPDPGTDDDEH